MVKSQEEQNEIRRQKDAARRRKRGVKPRKPAMSPEEKRASQAASSRKYRAKESASLNAAAISVDRTSKAEAMGIPVTKSQHSAIKEVVAELAHLSPEQIAGFTRVARKLHMAQRKVAEVVNQPVVKAVPVVNRKSEAAKQREAAKFPQYRDARLERDAEKAAQQRKADQDRNARIIEGQKRLAGLRDEGKELNTPFRAGLPGVPSHVPVEDDNQTWSEAEESTFLAELNAAQVEQEARLVAEVRREEELKAMIKRGEISEGDVEFFGLDRPGEG